MELSSYIPIMRRRIGGRDWSGLAWDAHSHHMLAIRNSSPRICELDPDGKVLRQSPRLDLEDPEDLAVWSTDEESIFVYVVEERPNRLALVELERRNLKAANIWRWSLGDSLGNRGPEGCDIDWVRGHLLIAYEKPARFCRIPLERIMPDAPSLEGDRSELMLEGIRDASGIVSTFAGLCVLSDESACLKRIHGDERLEIEHKQAEGIAIDGKGRLWIIGEPDELVIYELGSMGVPQAGEKASQSAFELLPKGLSVVEVGLALGLAGEVLALFDATDSSRRHYDHVNRLDRRTFWTAHSHQGNGASHFRKMRQSKRAWAALGKRAMELGIGLAKVETLCEDWWWERSDTGYGERRGTWLDELLRYAGRDKTIAAWQFEFWKEKVFDDGMEDALEAGLTTCGAVASLASADSSADSWDEKLGARIAKARAKGGKLAFGGGRWQIEPLPSWVKEEQRQDYYALVVWRAYTTAKDKIRNRMNAIWDAYYALTWGPLPDAHDRDNSINWTFRARHRGVSMEVFDTPHEKST